MPTNNKNLKYKYILCLFITITTAVFLLLGYYIFDASSLLSAFWDTLLDAFSFFISSVAENKTPTLQGIGNLVRGLLVIFMSLYTLREMYFGFFLVELTNPLMVIALGFINIITTLVNVLIINSNQTENNQAHNNETGQNHNNKKGLLIHLMGDLVISGAVVTAGVLLFLGCNPIVDLMASCVIAGVMFSNAVKMLKLAYKDFNKAADNKQGNDGLIQLDQLGYENQEPQQEPQDVNNCHQNLASKINNLKINASNTKEPTYSQIDFLSATL